MRRRELCSVRFVVQFAGISWRRVDIYALLPIHSNEWPSRLI